MNVSMREKSCSINFFFSLNVVSIIFRKMDFIRNKIDSFQFVGRGSLFFAHFSFFNSFCNMLNKKTTYRWEWENVFTFFHIFHSPSLFFFIFRVFFLIYSVTLILSFRIRVASSSLYPFALKTRTLCIRNSLVIVTYH